jgi:hypothetical protein
LQDSKKNSFSQHPINNKEKYTKYHSKCWMHQLSRMISI